ncbi:hypothetical protein FIBSPDRAFT_137347 [Athelia psychrophila]|uniref:Uncharacterized protein n=1 Tax=Athelia psychrophila TaxID=1759441 RepID=A0A166C133_9AGAM|nr:hypothetical protein FIBSPDRAFT_137347 [Fibularhizoctonia sp. CBS 109695]
MEVNGTYAICAYITRPHVCGHLETARHELFHRFIASRCFSESALVTCSRSHGEWRETRKLVPESRTELQRLFILSKGEAERCPDGKPIPEVTHTSALAGTTQTWDNKVPGRYFDGSAS